MSLKTRIVSRIAERLTSADAEARRRTSAERRRKAAGAPHRVDYFHQADDPYSLLTAQVLPTLRDRYDIDLHSHLVSAPPDWAAPDRDRLISWSQIDAARLAAKAGFARADPGPADPGKTPAGPTAEGDALRARLGHYLGATFHYGGEWYWGLDRLHYLEERLASLGARRDGAPASVIYAQPTSPGADTPASGVSGELEFFLSFRSPYTAIVAARVKALADAWSVPLKLRFVLPMVMRGLPVPPPKRRYITMDTAREARRLGVPFGRVADPVGKPVERGYSLLPWAVEQGRGYAYCAAFLRAVWSQGVDAGEDAGLRAIVEAAGLDWSRARLLIGNDDWRAEAEANRLELLDLGLWGVPCFRYGDTVAWGQDRLWVIEDALRASAQRTFIQ